MEYNNAINLRNIILKVFLWYKIKKLFINFFKAKIFKKQKEEKEKANKRGSKEGKIEEEKKAKEEWTKLW